MNVWMNERMKTMHVLVVVCRMVVCPCSVQNIHKVIKHTRVKKGRYNHARKQTKKVRHMSGAIISSSELSNQWQAFLSQPAVFKASVSATTSQAKQRGTKQEEEEEATTNKVDLHRVRFLLLFTLLTRRALEKDCCLGCRHWYTMLFILANYAFHYAVFFLPKLC